MQIIILPNVKRLALRYNGEELTWSYSVWANLYQSTTEEIFGPTNEYLATLPAAKKSTLWKHFKQAHHLLNSVGETSQLSKELIGCVNGIAELFDYDELLNWVTSNDVLQMDQSIPVANDSRNSDAMTILRYEAFELSVFCIIAKLMTPIWGTYVDIVKEDVGNLHKERIAARIFYDSNFAQMRPYLRFKEYIDALAHTRSKNTSTALMYGMPSADLDKYLMGLSLIRRFTVIRLRTSRDGSIMAFTYKFLEDKITQLANTNYRDKFASSKDGDVEGDSYADQYRIPQDVSDEIPVTTECYLDDICRVCGDLEFTPEMVENAVNIQKALNSNERFVISDFHMPLTALVLRNVIFPETLYHVERPQRINAIAVSAARAVEMGLDDIYKLLTAVKVPADINSMEMTVQNGRALRRLPPELDQKLIEQYAHLRPAQISAKTNPGRELIDLIVKDINANEWLGLESIENIRASVALFIINRI